MSFSSCIAAQYVSALSYRPYLYLAVWIGKSVFSPLADQLGLSLCRACVVIVFTNPRPNQELLNLFYSGDDYGCHEANKSNEALRTAELLLEFVEGSGPKPSQKSLLDFGCGGGFLLENAIRLGWKTRLVSMWGRGHSEHVASRA